MQVLLTAVAYQSFGALLSRPGIDWLLMNEILELARTNLRDLISE